MGLPSLWSSAQRYVASFALPRVAATISALQEESATVGCNLPGDGCLSVHENMAGYGVPCGPIGVGEPRKREAVAAGVPQADETVVR
eukprot:1003207-Pleurochrysis_carterae.AAC.2